LHSKNIPFMTKKEALEQVKKAKTSHKKWMTYAKAIHMGIKLDKDAVPLLETDCVFGKWYYGPAQAFESLESFQEIEQYHTLLHETYQKMYLERKKEAKGGFFTSKSSAERKKKAVLDQYMNQLTQISEMLKEKLTAFENELKEMSDVEFKKLVEG